MQQSTNVLQERLKGSTEQKEYHCTRKLNRLVSLVLLIQPRETSSLFFAVWYAFFQLDSGIFAESNEDERNSLVHEVWTTRRFVLLSYATICTSHFHFDVVSLTTQLDDRRRIRRSSSTLSD